jgi:hypothetical protein
MKINIGMVNFDCLDPAATAAWWAEQLDGTVTTVIPEAFFIVDSPSNPTLAFQQVPDPTPGKNRIHLDLVAEDRAAAVAAFVAAGATVLAQFEHPGVAWTVLIDPAGFQFCIAQH